MLLLGIDIGTSSIKVSVMDAHTRKTIAVAGYPDTETGILALKPGWAEQSPEMWWEHTQQAILRLHAQKTYNPADISAIGIAYQMHGLVLTDRNQNVLRDSIIWCDSRAVEIGERAFENIGPLKCLGRMLNSPGNFTAAKLAWVKEYEPEIYSRIDKVMLPGDFIAMKLTGEITTSISALSEGIFWDFQRNELSTELFDYFGFAYSFIPAVRDVFSEHGRLKKEVATALSLTPGTPVCYKAGDQPNNALSLNVLRPGEVAATAGTSGVIYGVGDQLGYDEESRVNTFAHVNYTLLEKRLGILLCINGTGILNRWLRSVTGNRFSYAEMNRLAAEIPPGSEGLMILPFGNGAERMLKNRTPGAFVQPLDFNKHNERHLFRAAQEGIAFAFRYGLDIMRENGMRLSVIRAGKSNMFLSELFLQSFVNATQVPVELYNSDGSAGAAIGAGIGAKIYTGPQDAFLHFKPANLVEPSKTALYEELYEKWKTLLEKELKG